MPLTYPLDILNGFPGMTTRFDLVNVQELEVTWGGKQLSADLGPALWEMEAQSRLLKPSVLRLWKAKLHALENGAKLFNGYDLTACFPLAYPRGSWPTGLAFSGIGALHAATANTLRIRELPVGLEILQGDYVSFLRGTSQDLYQAMESVTVPAGTIVSPAFEVRPAIIQGAALTAAVAAQVPVALIKPHALMLIVPGSVSAPANLDGWGSISFAGRQTR